MLNACTGFVKRLGEEGGPIPGVGLVWNDRSDAALSRGEAIGIAVISLIADDRARLDIGTEIEKHGKLRRIAFLAAAKIEGEIITVEIGLQMDFGREAAARTAERLIVLPPFAPAAETWARTTVESNICTKCADELNEARWSKNISNTPALLNRLNLFHTLFHLPKRFGSARQVML